MPRLTPACLACACLGPLAACATYIEDRTAAEFAPVYEETVGFVAAPVTGGIYAAGSGGLFVSDRKAAAVGDVLTVQFTERFQATKSQAARGARSSSYEIDLPDLLTGGFDDGELTNGTDQSFAGSGGAAQSNSFTGRLTVSVVRVLPNGHLEIMGQKRLTLNNGNEFVRLTGVVRPEDIGPDNVVLSDRVAHADIRYVGAGDPADTARPGWLRRGLAVVSPL
jgi:flagellar L-ring protein precursor FlgH